MPGILEHFSRAAVSPSCTSTPANVGPASGFCGSASVIFQTQQRRLSNRPAGRAQFRNRSSESNPLRGNCLRWGRRGIPRENSQRLRVLGNCNDGKIRNGVDVAGNRRCVAVEGPLAVVVIRRGLDAVRQRSISNKLLVARRRKRKYVLNQVNLR